LIPVEKVGFHIQGSPQSLIRLALLSQHDDVSYSPPDGRKYDKKPERCSEPMRYVSYGVFKLCFPPPSGPCPLFRGSSFSSPLLAFDSTGVVIPLLIGEKPRRMRRVPITRRVGACRRADTSWHPRVSDAAASRDAPAWSLSEGAPIVCAVEGRG